MGSCGHRPGNPEASVSARLSIFPFRITTICAGTSIDTVIGSVSSPCQAALHGLFACQPVKPLLEIAGL